MKKFNIYNQPYVSDKYKLANNLSEELQKIAIAEVIVPDINEIVGTIYAFVNINNGKFYIGQTYTKYYERFGKHFVDCFTMNSQLYFHNSIRKHGWHSFQKIILWQSDLILEKNEDNKAIMSKILDDKEKEFIKLYNATDSEFGYNLTEGGKSTDTSLKRKHIPRKKSLNKRTGLKYGNHPMAKPIYQYSISGEFIKEWECKSLAEDILNINICANSITSHDFIWILKEDFSEEKLNKLVDFPKVKIERIYQYDFNDQLIGVYDNYHAAERVLGIPAAEIASGENKYAVHDYFFFKESNIDNVYQRLFELKQKSKHYLHKHKPVYQVFLDGTVVKTWDNLESIRNVYEKSMASINKCLRHKLNFFNNCLWIYEDEFSDDIVDSKINLAKSRHKTLVNDILSGKVIYNEDAYKNSKHNTAKNKKDM